MFILQENIRTALFPCRIAEDGTAPPGGKVRWQVMDIMQKLHIEFVATHRKVYFSCFLIRSVLWPKSPKTKACRSDITIPISMVGDADDRR